MLTALRLGRMTTLIMVATMLCAPAAGAMPFDPTAHDWEGYADFVETARAKLGDRLVVTARVDFGSLRPEDGLMLVHPESHLDVESLGGFLASGGRIVLADDFGTSDRLLRRYGIERRPLPASPAESLRNNPELAIAVPVGTSDLVLDVTRVVTNHAMGFTNPELTPLLEVGSAKGRSGGPPESSVPVVLALVGQTDRGKLVVIGDPSIFINSMLRYPGNAQLARNVASSADHGGKVYLAVGAFEQVGTYTPPSTDSSAGASHARAWASSALSSFTPWIAQVLAALVGLGIVVWIGSVAGRTYRRARPRLTRIIPLFTQGGAAGHAAVVGGPGSPREAALVEIGKALEEELTLALGLPRVPLYDELVGRLSAERLVRPDTAAALRKLLSRVTHIDTLTSAGRGAAVPRASDEEVLSAARLAARVRSEVNDAARSGVRTGRAA